MQAVVITLERTPERLAAFLADWSLDIPLSVHLGSEAGGPKLGCYQSHIEVLSSYSGPLLVLEDDAVFASGAAEAIATAPTDYDLVYVGGEHIRGIIRRTHGYIAPDPGKIAAMLGKPYGHVDYALAALDVTRHALDPFVVGQRAGVSSISGLRRVKDRYWN